MMIDEIYNCRQACIPVANVSEEWKQEYELFEKSLSEEQLGMFHKLCDLQSETAGEDMRSAYKAGFIDGIELISETKHNKQNRNNG